MHGVYILVGESRYTCESGGRVSTVQCESHTTSNKSRFDGSPKKVQIEIVSEDDLLIK